MRILITGGPGTGKSHLAETMKRIEMVDVQYGPRRITMRDAPALCPVMLCTDPRKLGGDAENSEWSAVSEEVAGWLDKPSPWVIEGVAIPRALRKWRGKHIADVSWRVTPLRRPEAPCDKLIILRHRHPAAGPETPGQAAMAKGLHTVLSEVLEGWPELRRITEFR